MDLRKHYTHWSVDPIIRQWSEEVRSRHGGSWNTYRFHGDYPGQRGERFTIDHWGPGGRGHPLPEHQGDAIVAWILGMAPIRPVRLLIWYSWYYTPSTGWLPYSGYQGNHGPGPDAHVHVAY